MDGTQPMGGSTGARTAISGPGGQVPYAVEAYPYMPNLSSPAGYGRYAFCAQIRAEGRRDTPGRGDAYAGRTGFRRQDIRSPQQVFVAQERTGIAPAGAVRGADI